MINIIKNIIVIFNKPFRQTMIFLIPSLITGKPVKIQSRDESDVSNVFTDILSNYPKLNSQIYQANDKEYRNIIRGLDLVYDYLVENSSDSHDITQQQNQQIMNRINFFSSAPAKNPDSITETPTESPDQDDSDSDESDDYDLDQDDAKLLQRLELVTMLGPIDKSRKVLSKDLKPAGTGFKRPPRPLYDSGIGAASPIPGSIPSGSKPSGSKPSGSKPSGSKPSGSKPYKQYVGSRALYAGDDERNFMKELENEFDDYVDPDELEQMWDDAQDDDIQDDQDDDQDDQDDDQDDQDYRSEYSDADLDDVFGDYD